MKFAQMMAAAAAPLMALSSMPGGTLPSFLWRRDGTWRYCNGPSRSNNPGSFPVVQPTPPSNEPYTPSRQVRKQAIVKARSNAHKATPGLTGKALRRLEKRARRAEREAKARA